MPVPFNTAFTIPDDVLVSLTDGEAVLLELGSECYFGLDETGTRLWELLRSTGSIQGMYEAALAEFDVDEERLRRDVEEFVDGLVSRRLIKLAPS